MDHDGYDAWDSADPDRVWSTYFDMLGDAAASGLFDILAHPDLVKVWGRGRPEPPRPRREYYDLAIERIAKADVAIEVSTAGLRKPVGEIYPARDLLEMFVEAGKPVALSSDAHGPRPSGMGMTRPSRSCTTSGSTGSVCSTVVPAARRYSDEQLASHGHRLRLPSLPGVWRPARARGRRPPGRAGSPGTPTPMLCPMCACRRAPGGGGTGRHRRPFSGSRSALGNADSIELGLVAGMLTDQGWRTANADVTVIAERPRLDSLKAQMRDRLAGALGVEGGRVNVKATTNEGMGAVGAVRASRCLRWRRSNGRHQMLRNRSASRTPASDLRLLEPRWPGRVGIYVWPTVYGRIHVGGARPYVMFALFKRFLEHEAAGRHPGREHHRHQRQDLRRRRTGSHLGSAGAGDDALYRADTDRLALGRPDSEPLATETLAEIIALIEALIEGGHAYASQGDVYFSAAQLPGVREAVQPAAGGPRSRDQGEPEEEQALKRDPLDFALWKAHKAGEDTAWESPGTRTAGLAHRVLGDGGEGPWPGLRGARRRVRPSCSRTTRTRSPRPRRRAANRSPASGCTTA